MAFDHLIDETELQPKRSTKHRFRARLFEAWSHCCAYCNSPADTLDHVLPRSCGGLTVVENLIPACRRCNGAKSSADWREWFALQDWHCPDRAARIDAWINRSAGELNGDALLAIRTSNFNQSFLHQPRRWGDLVISH